MTRLANLMCDLNDLLGLEAALQSRWQHRVREQPQLVERVLAEVGMLKKERRIRVSPAAAAEDLFKRWSTT